MGSKQVVTDDYERWYTEHVNNNRMVLSLRSGIHHEVNWALDRLCRLCDNEKFHLQDLPGLIEALFEWPEWYIREGIKGRHSLSALFSKPAEDEKNTRHALLSIMVLHNASVFLPNAMSLVKYSRTRPFILDAMQQLDPNDDTQAEFLIILIQLFGTIIAAQPSSAIVPSPNTNPIPALENVVKVTSNRSLLVASLTTLALLFTESQNAAFFKATSPTLAAALRCIPMFTFADKDVTDAALNYLYVHLSNASMAKAFLLHPDMPSTLRLLVQLILSEQKEEITAVPILSTPVFPAGYVHTRFRGLSKQEADVIGVMPEPERTYEWMKNSFELRPDGEVTQVEFWNLYKDTFWPYRDVHTLLTAGEVIGKLSTVFPNAQAMVLPGMPQRFVVRGLVRKPETRFLCAWEHNQCPTAPFQSRGELVEHVHGHITERVEDEFPCLWASCSQAALPKASLWPHVATHLPGPTLPGPALSEQAATTFSVPRAINDPTPTSLTALLCIRLLFHLSHSAAGSAPRLDADHFGFPGTVEEDEDEVIVIPVEDEAEGEQRGRKAFISIRHLLERVQIKDDALTGWIAEMLEAATYSPSI